jgi:hypothetical protein
MTAICEGRFFFDDQFYCAPPHRGARTNVFRPNERPLSFSSN